MKERSLYCHEMDQECRHDCLSCDDGLNFDQFEDDDSWIDEVEDEFDDEGYDNYEQMHQILDDDN